MKESVNGNIYTNWVEWTLNGDLLNQVFILEKITVEPFSILLLKEAKDFVKILDFTDSPQTPLEILHYRFSTNSIRDFDRCRCSQFPSQKDRALNALLRALLMWWKDCVFFRLVLIDKSYITPSKNLTDFTQNICLFKEKEL